MAEHEKKEQVKPLAPAAHRFIDERDPFSNNYTARPTRKFIKLCGCCTAVLLILVVIILVLAFTVFHVQDPILNTNFVTFDRVGAVLNGTNNFRPGHNLTMVAEISIQNPNAAPFKIYNATTNVYYNGLIIGEGKSLEGRIKARRTLRRNVTIDIIVDKVLNVTRFSTDFDLGILAISTYTSVNGKVNVMNVIKRSFVERINCTMNVNISSLAIQDLSSRRWVL